MGDRYFFEDFADLAIRDRLTYLTGRRKSLKQFHKWFMLFYAEHWYGSTKLMHVINHALNEYSSGIISRKELMSRLTNYKS